MDEEIKCVCPGLDKAIKEGVESMIKEHAPTFVIDDFVWEMLHGGWSECSRCERRGYDL